MTYTERLTEIAEKMAKAAYNKHKEERGEQPAFEILKILFPDDFKKIVEMHVPLAAICLAEMAKEFEEGYRTFDDMWCNDGEQPTFDDLNLLKENGLIP